MKLFVLGNVGIDRFYYVKRFPFNGETILSTKEIDDIGGKDLINQMQLQELEQKYHFGHT